MSVVKRLKSTCEIQGGLVEKYAQDGDYPLKGKRIFLIHHLTKETLVTIECLLELGASQVAAQFCSYNLDAKAIYGPSVRRIGADKLRACKLLENMVMGEQRFVVDSDFLQWDGVEFPVATLNSFFGTNGYLTCARAMGIWQLLRVAADCKKANEKVLIIEDGGYTAPLLNHDGHDGLTVADFRKKWNAPPTQKQTPCCQRNCLMLCPNYSPAAWSTRETATTRCSRCTLSARTNC